MQIGTMQRRSAPLFQSFGIASGMVIGGHGEKANRSQRNGLVEKEGGDLNNRFRTKDNVAQDRVNAANCKNRKNLNWHSSGLSINKFSAE